jgi:phosphohistidine phosphatase
MKILVVRHAPAEDRIRFARTGLPDAERPLTTRGRKKFVRAARTLANLVPTLSVLATSPYTRAVETAAILRRAYGGLPLTQLSVLAPGGQRDELIRWIADVGSASDEVTIAIVGHEPDASELVGALVTGSAMPLFALAKGGACLLECSTPLSAGHARIRWLMTLRQLRRMSR